MAVPQPGCTGLQDLFFGPELDGRNEVGRNAREQFCKSICFRCPLRLRCLRRAATLQMYPGVWGGMGEGERRRFYTFLEQYGEIPEEEEFRAAVAAFYQEEAKRQGARKKGRSHAS